MTAPDCGSPGCARPVTARGLCHAHYERQRRGGAASRPVRDRSAEPLEALPGVRVSAGLAEALRARAHRHGLSLSDLVRATLGECARMWSVAAPPVSESDARPSSRKR